MSFSTYSDLENAIASFLARDDLTVSIPDFITLFEASAARRLRVRAQETTATLTPSSGTAALPSGFLGVRSLTWNGQGGGELIYAHPTYLRALYATTDSGTPTHYTIEGGNIVLRPSDDTTLTLRYSAKNDAVSGVLNSLFTNHPDAYLFGSLAEAYGFTGDDANEAKWRRKRDAVFDEIFRLDFRERAGMSIRVMGATP